MEKERYKIVFTIVMCLMSLIIAFCGIKVGGFSLKQAFGIFLMIYANNISTWDNIKKFLDKDS